MNVEQLVKNLVAVGKACRELTHVIKNIRFGFATNSSSSHSLVYLTDPIPDHDTAPRTADNEFGWEDFRLMTLRDKLFYVLTARIGHGGFWGEGAEQARKAALADALATHAPDFFPDLVISDFSDALGGYVDHESLGVVTLAHARDPHVVVFGGNDNSGSSAYREYTLKSGKVDWTKTTPADEDELAYVPPALRATCDECGKLVFWHHWKCPKAPCYQCHAPGRTPHHEECSSGGKAKLVGDCNECGASRGDAHEMSCYLYPKWVMK